MAKHQGKYWQGLLRRVRRIALRDGLSKELTSELRAMAGIAGLLLAGPVAALDNLTAIEPPAELDNVHVQKLYSDVHGTQLLIFVKRGVPLHRHQFHSESLYVLAGSGRMTLGDQRFDIAAGDFFTVPEDVVHGVEVTSSQPLKVLSMQAPEFFGKDRVFELLGDH